ncbi:MAG: hypothetical protein AB8B61_05850 [Cyclobacteriaceae bacterium]
MNSKQILYRLLAILVLCVVHILPLSAQNADEVFGNNRVQYKQWNWKRITTDNFIVYYYVGGNNIAYNAARYAERELKKVIEKTGFTPRSQITMMVYNSLEDMQMSNVDFERKVFIGGETDLVKSRIEIAYPGTQTGFKKEVNRRLTKLMLEVMLFGGSLKSMIQSSYLVKIPPWFVEGAAKYVSEGWSAELNGAVKSTLITKRNKPRNFVGNNAVLVGQSIWNYVAEEYGEDDLANILNLTRITRREKTAIESTLGLPYKVFLKGWRNYYLTLNDSTKIETIEPSKKEKIRRHNRKNRIYKEVAFSPSGQYLAYSENFLGRYKIKVLDTETGKKKTFHKVGRRITDRPLNLDIPLISWQTDTSLGMVVYKKGKVSFLMKNTDTKKLVENNFKVIDEVLGMDFSDDGKWVVFSALKDGRTDLFLYHYKTNIFKRITFDLYDDVDPSFLKNSLDVVFSSNRLDTLLKGDRGNFETVKDDFELYLYKYNRKDTVTRLTYLKGNEFEPKALSENEISFLNTKGNKLSLHKLDLKTRKVSQVSNYHKNIQAYDINPTDGMLAFIMEDKTNDYLYLNKDFSVSEELVSINNEPPVLDSIVEVEVPRFPSVYDITISDYFFESERKQFYAKIEQEKKDSVQKVKDDRIRIRGPYDYKLLLALDKMITTPFFDQLRGFGLFQEVSTSELFGDHRFVAGYYGDFTNLNVGRIYGEYRYLRKRMDFSFRYDREGIQSQGNGSANSVNQEYFINKFVFGLDYPLTPSTRLSFSPGFERTTFSDVSVIQGTLDFSSRQISQNYLSISNEFIVDNTYEKGLNMLEGTRLKVSYKTYMNFEESKRNFARLFIDIRNYQKVHKEIIFATRMVGGAFLGNAKKSFLLGGMDNWLNRQTEGDPLGSIDPESTDIDTRDRSNALFFDYVTTLRGFNYNQRFGNNVALVNAELRIPLFKYLFSKPVNSSVLRNFQLIGFTDAGTAWSGSALAINGDENLFETNTVSNTSGLSAEVKRFRGSFLYSYGVGVRTLISNYYVKLDLAFPKELVLSDRDPALHITFGYDF